MYIRPNKNFRIAKQTKRLMALGRFKDSAERNDFKNVMIQAQLFGDQIPVKKTKDKE